MAASAGEVASILLTQPPTANMGSMGTQGGSNIMQGSDYGHLITLTWSSTPDSQLETLVTMVGNP